MSSEKKNGKSSLPSEHEPVDSSRRNLLKGASMVGVAALGSSAENIIAQDGGASSRRDVGAREALEVLTSGEAETLDAICNCLIPSDEYGPGAFEARAVHYIDKSLASHDKSMREKYMVSLESIDRYAEKTKGKAFHLLMNDLQVSVLLDVENNKVPGCSPSGKDFFNMVRNHTIDGTFCDPYYGGNQNFVGWDMINYPGIRLGASEADVAAGAELEPNHQSAYDHDTYTKMASNQLLGELGRNGDA